MTNIAGLFSTWLSCLTVGNIILFLLFLYFLHVLNEMYEFKNMPPGPRFTSLPVIGNFFSFDAKADDVKDATLR